MVTPPSSKTRMNVMGEIVQEMITIPSQTHFQVLTPNAEGLPMENTNKLKKTFSQISSEKASQHSRCRQRDHQCVYHKNQPSGNQKFHENNYILTRVL
jgi:hypothetical protein